MIEMSIVVDLRANPKHDTEPLCAGGENPDGQDQFRSAAHKCCRLKGSLQHFGEFLRG